MKKLALGIFILQTFCGFSQWSLQVSSRVEKEGKGLPGANITLLQAGKLIKSTQSDGDGYFSMDVPPNGDFMIEVSSAGCNTKKFQVLTRGVPAEVADEGFMPNYKIGGFTMKPPLPGIDYTALRNPVVKILYINKLGKFDHEDAHTEMMLAALGKIKAAEDELIRKQEAFVKSGDQALKKEDCASAKAAYESAIQTIPLSPYQDYSQSQLVKCGACIAEKENAAKKEAEKIAAEKAAADKKAEEDRLAKEKAEKDRREAELKKEEKLAASKAEEERLAKEKAARDQAAAEAKKQAEKKAEEERIAREKSEKDKRDAELKKEEEKKLAAKRADEGKPAKERAGKEQAAFAETEKRDDKKQAVKKAEEERRTSEQNARTVKKAEEERTAKDKATADKTKKEAEAGRLAGQKGANERPAPAPAANPPAPSGGNQNAQVANKSEPVSQKREIGSSRAKYSIPRVLGMDPYKAAISRADELFKDKRYAEAKEAYESALSARPADAYAKRKIEEVNKLGAR